MLPSYVAIAPENDTVDVDHRDLTKVAAALQKQVIRDFAGIWGVQANVSAFLALEDIPTGYWPIIVSDDIRTPGAAGIHLDKDGQPFSLVQNGEGWSLTASHECLEMLVDPNGSRVAAGWSIKPGQGRVEYLVEVCDPCEALEFAYAVNGIAVSDFYTPDYFQMKAVPGVRYSFSGAIKKPCQVLKGGYLSWHEPVSDHWWQAIVTSSRPKFQDLGVFTAVKENLRHMTDRQMGFDELAPELTASLPKQDERLRAARTLQAKAAEPSPRKAQIWRTQIAGLRTGDSGDGS
jgi:hypothetical protein